MATVGRTIPSSQPAAVRVDGLRLARGGALVLEVDHLDLAAGTVISLVGPNGSGKSTLLHAIAGLLEPDAGRIEVLGTDPAAARARVAYVLQGVAVTEHLPITVREVVTMGRYAARGLFGRLRPDDRRIVDRAVERLELGGLLHRHLGELSGGQRQRALVAQALAQEAHLLLLDEPVTGLDLPSVERIRSVIAEEQAAGRTVVVATHDLNDAREADQLVLLAGRVVAAGPPERALTGEALTEAYAGRLLRVAGDLLLVDDGAHHAHVSVAHDRHDHHVSHPEP